MWNVLNRKKNRISDFLDFHFSSYGHFFTKNCQSSMNFHDNYKNKKSENWFFIRFSKLRIFHESGISLVWTGPYCNYLVSKALCHQIMPRSGRLSNIVQFGCSSSQHSTVKPRQVWLPFRGKLTAVTSAAISWHMLIAAYVITDMTADSSIRHNWYDSW